MAERSMLILLIILIAAVVSSPVDATKYSIVIYEDSPSFSMPLPSIGYALPIVPVSGVVRVLVVAAAYPDVNYTLSIAQLKKEWDGTVAAYYHEVSYGKLTIQSDFHGWYKLPYPKAHYGKNCISINDADCSGSDQSFQIANEVMPALQKDVNFFNYDYYVFIHSGPGQETSGDRNDVWSVTYMSGVWIRTNSKTLTKFSVVPEIEAKGTVPYGIWCLEFGHDLGLPDLYNTNSHKTILGPWELMDEGSLNGNPPGSSPAHMTAWDKIQLGFISGRMLATAYPSVNSTFTVDPTEIASTNVHAIKIWPTNAPNSSQYYLVEVRTKRGFDSALPSEGVLITYVDETLSIGPVRVMDAHPEQPGLEDAVWNVNQTFTDAKNNLVVKIIGKVGNAYRITVTSNSEPTLPFTTAKSPSPLPLQQILEGVVAAEAKLAAFIVIDVDAGRLACQLSSPSYWVV
ncbi:MAG: M6 family metalloprotease domain-containing protein [Candidatus Bathyarchaeia archaeon]